jgi:hypothetical protein
MLAGVGVCEIDASRRGFLKTYSFPSLSRAAGGAVVRTECS